MTELDDAEAFEHYDDPAKREPAAGGHAIAVPEHSHDRSPFTFERDDRKLSVHWLRATP